MIDDRKLKSWMAEIAMELFPPLLRKSLLDDDNFVNEYQLKVDSIISFGDIDVSFYQTRLFQAIRNTISGSSNSCVPDTRNVEWKLDVIQTEDGNQNLVLAHAEKKITLHDIYILSQEDSFRVQSFENRIKEIFIRRDTREKWHNILAERSLIDSEIFEYYEDINESISKKKQEITNSINKNQINIANLVPNNHKYYENLIGVYDGSSSIKEYASKWCNNHFQEILNWNIRDGFLHSLLLSSHSSIVDELLIENISNEDLLQIYNLVEEKGDRVSQVGAIEVGTNSSINPEIEPILIRIIEQIRDDNISKKDSAYKLFSALFILVYGELSRIRLFSDTPIL